MERDRKAAFSAGCNDYQTKPICEMDLLASISKSLRKD